ncbi:MAG TPA: right-handed parallel beta-helix repeat-containing protein [Pirellulales bacterium]
MSVTGGDVTISDCRAFGCGGAGFSADRCRLTMRTCIARECANGFDVRRLSAESSLFGLIAGMNWRNGFRLRECADLSINSCNASRNGEAGFQLEACRGAALLACVAMQNSLNEPGQFAGVQLADHCRQNTIGYSLLADIQGLPAPRNMAVKADATSGENVIRYNVVGDPQRPETAKKPVPPLTSGKAPPTLATTCQGDAPNGMGRRPRTRESTTNGDEQSNGKR